MKQNIKQKIIDSWKKPVDWRDIVISLFLISMFKRQTAYLAALVGGIISGSSQIDYLLIFERAAATISNAYNIGFIKLFEAGQALGRLTEPYNLILGQVLFCVIVGYIIMLMLSTGYKITKYIWQSVKRKRGDKRAKKKEDELQSLG